MPPTVESRTSAGLCGCVRWSLQADRCATNATVGRDGTSACPASATDRRPAAVKRRTAGHAEATIPAGHGRGTARHRRAGSPRPGRNRLPVTRSEMPVRSRYGVTPPRWNGQPAPRIMHRSMSCGLGDDALVQHEPDLLGQRVERALAAPRRRSSGASPGHEQLRHLGVDARRRPAAAGPARRSGLQVRADREPVRERLVQRLADVQRDGRADELQQRQRAHRQAQRVERARRPRRAGCPRRSRAKTSPRKRVSSRLTTNAGASLTSTQDFFSALPTANAVASVASSVCSPRTISSSGRTRDRVEEVEADDPLRVRQVGGHRGDRQRRGVGREDASRARRSPRPRPRPAS